MFIPKLALLLLPAAVGFTLVGDPAGPAPLPLVAVATAEPPVRTADPTPAAVKDATDDRTAELKHFAGEWIVARIETEGKTLPKTDLKGARVVIKGNAASVTKVSGLADFTFAVDPKRERAAIDATFTAGPLDGETCRGIYVRRDGSIRICLRLDKAELGRPKGFFTSQGSGSITIDLLSAADEIEPAKPPATDPTTGVPAARKPNPAVPAAATCRVSGSLTSTEYAKMGGTLDRAIVTARTHPGGKQVGHADTRHRAYPVGDDFAFALPPGKYVLECTGVGSRGATFVPTEKAFTVGPADKTIKLDPIDLPASEITKLFGKPAPELGGVAAWKNTDPLTIKGLRGKVVVLDFWSYSCSICVAHKPDLAKLADKYADRGLVVLAVHDATADTLAEVDAKVPEAIKQKAGHLPVALDGKGAKGVFRAYGVRAVPTVILIDQDGTVVRRFHHAGDPELEKEVARLLKGTK